MRGVPTSGWLHLIWLPSWPGKIAPLPPPLSSTPQPAVLPSEDLSVFKQEFQTRQRTLWQRAGQTLRAYIGGKWPRELGPSGLPPSCLLSAQTLLPLAPPSPQAAQVPRAPSSSWTGKATFTALGWRQRLEEQPPALPPHRQPPNLTFPRKAICDDIN